MNSIDMRLEIKPANTRPTKPAESAASKPEQSDFRKELENTAQNSKDQNTVGQPDNPSQSGTEQPVEDAPVEQAPSMPSENTGMEDAAAMLAAMLLPIVVVPEETVQQTEVVQNVGTQDGASNLVEMVQTPVQVETVQQVMQQSGQQVVQTENASMQLTAQQTAETVQVQQPTMTQQASQQAETASNQNTQAQQTVTVQSTVPQQDDGQKLTAEVHTSAQPVTNQPLFEHVEGTPIQVAQPVRADVPEFPNQLADKINQAVANGENTIEVQLAPRELGNITIRLSMTAEGTIVTLHSANAKTLSLLSEHAANIGAIVEQNHPGSVSVSVERDQASQQQQQQYAQQEQQRNSQQQQQQQQRQQAPPHNDDFIQQFRLGLIELSALQ